MSSFQSLLKKWPGTITPAFVPLCHCWWRRKSFLRIAPGRKTFHSLFQHSSEMNWNIFKMRVLANGKGYSRLAGNNPSNIEK
jgi:hypothetical protein